MQDRSMRDVNIGASDDGWVDPRTLDSQAAAAPPPDGWQPPPPDVALTPPDAPPEPSPIVVPASSVYAPEVTRGLERGGAVTDRTGGVIDMPIENMDVLAPRPQDEPPTGADLGVTARQAWDFLPTPRIKPTSPFQSSEIANAPTAPDQLHQHLTETLLGPASWYKQNVGDPLLGTVGLAAQGVASGGANHDYGVTDFLASPVGTVAGIIVQQAIERSGTIHRGDTYAGLDWAAKERQRLIDEAGGPAALNPFRVALIDGQVAGEVWRRFGETSNETVGPFRAADVANFGNPAWFALGGIGKGAGIATSEIPFIGEKLAPLVDSYIANAGLPGLTEGAGLIGGAFKQGFLRSSRAIGEGISNGINSLPSKIGEANPGAGYFAPRTPSRVVAERRAPAAGTASGPGNFGRGGEAITTAPDLESAGVTHEFRYKVVDAGDLIASHEPNGVANPTFPKELQPRDRTRAGSQAQAQDIGSKLDPNALLTDFHSVDRGTPIARPDNVVISGNGRTMGLKWAIKNAPEKYAAYRDALIAKASEFGMNPAQIGGMKNPVLVRVRQSVATPDAEFARMANGSTSLKYGASETANLDAGRMNDNILSSLTVPQGASVEEALRSPANRHILEAFGQSLPENERRGLLDASGNWSREGVQRIRNAMFAKVYPGPTGQQLLQAFTESTDAGMKNIEAALFQSLPAMARAEGMIAAGSRDAALTLTDDILAAVSEFHRLRMSGMNDGEIRAQAAQMQGPSLVPEVGASPERGVVLGHLVDLAAGRSPARLRAFIESYARAVEELPPAGQGALFGAPEGKADLLRRAGVEVPPDPNANQPGLLGADELAGAARADTGPAAARFAFPGTKVEEPVVARETPAAPAPAEPTPITKKGRGRRAEPPPVEEIPITPENVARVFGMPEPVVAARDAITQLPREFSDAVRRLDRESGPYDVAKAIVQTPEALAVVDKVLAERGVEATTQTRQALIDALISRERARPTGGNRRAWDAAGAGDGGDVRPPAPPAAPPPPEGEGGLEGALRRALQSGRLFDTGFGGSVEANPGVVEEVRRISGKTLDQVAAEAAADPSIPANVRSVFMDLWQSEQRAARKRLAQPAIGPGNGEGPFTPTAADIAARQRAIREAPHIAAAGEREARQLDIQASRARAENPDFQRLIEGNAKKPQLALPERAGGEVPEIDTEAFARDRGATMTDAETRAQAQRAAAAKGTNLPGYETMTREQIAAQADEFAAKMRAANDRAKATGHDNAVETRYIRRIAQARAEAMTVWAKHGADAVALANEIPAEQWTALASQMKSRAGAAPNGGVLGFANAALDVMQIPQSALASADVSYSFRQMLAFSAAHPFVFGRTFVDQLHAYRDPAFAEKFLTDMATDVERFGGRKLFIPQVGGNVERGETQFGARQTIGSLPIMHKLANTPVLGGLIKGSEPAAAVMAGGIRGRVYLNYVKAHPELWDQAGRDALANIINHASGRGVDLRDKSQAVVLAMKMANIGFFSPQNAIARFRFAWDVSRAMGRISVDAVHGRAPRLQDIEAVRLGAGYVAAVSSLWEVAHAAGLNVSFDWTDTNFGKIDLGKPDDTKGYAVAALSALGIGVSTYNGHVYIDPMGGEAQNVRLLARMIFAPLWQKAGDVTGHPALPFGNRFGGKASTNPWAKKFGDDDPLITMLNYFGSKLAPVPGLVYNTMHPRGNPSTNGVDWGDPTSNPVTGLLIPLWMQDAIQASGENRKGGKIRFDSSLWPKAWFSDQAAAPARPGAPAAPGGYQYRPPVRSTIPPSPAARQ